MRQFFAIGCALLMLGISTRDIMHYVAFKFNQTYISDVFCINKDKPELDCDGKCYLKKKLDTAKKDSDSRKIPPPDEKSSVVMVNAFITADHEVRQHTTHHSFYYLAIPYEVSYKGITPPPKHTT